VTDPNDPLRALSDMQRAGIAAAAEVFERLIADVSGREAPRLRVGETLAGLGDAGAGAGSLPQMRAAMAQAIDLYADLFRETFSLYADVVELAVRGGTATLSATRATGAPVALSAEPGHAALAPLWVHNATDAALTGIAPRVTDLAAHDGATVPGALATFEPVAFDVAPGASSSTMLAVAVPPSAPAGAYHGHVLAAGLPEASVAVRLVVGEAA
jgi:hypothetical protein